jgi:uncharacterized protein (DUF849 family)
MTPTRARAPHVPLTTDAIADDAERCFRAGARIVHLHARTADERPDWRREAYAEMIPAIRDRCPGIVICATTSGRDDPDLDHRTDVLDLEGDARPDMASLTVGSVNFPGGPSTTSIDDVDELARRMQAAGVRPELELFDLGMAHLAHRLIARGLLAPPLWANLMLGFPNAAPADARSLLAMSDALPPGTTWAAAGFGAYQDVTVPLAVAMGGHVRTGLEDNLFLDHVTREPATNERLVQRAVAHAELVRRDIATPAETRHVLGLPASNPAAPKVTA